MQHQIKNKLKTNATAQAMAASHGPYHTSPPPNRHLTAKPAATALWDRRVSKAGRVSWETESAGQVYERVTQASLKPDSRHTQAVILV